MRLLRRFKRIASLLSCLAFFTANGGHWVILQSVAWAQMWVRYAHTETVTKATAKTFDGKHPCTMCKRIVRAKSKEKTVDWTLSFEKYSIAKPIPIRLTLPTAFKVVQYGVTDRFFHSQARLAPPTPPPQMRAIS